MLIDWYDGNDYFSSVASANYVKRTYDEKNSQIVIFEYGSVPNDSSRKKDSRENILALANKIIERGAKVVILDYTFSPEKGVINLPEENIDKIIFGSQIVKFGHGKREAPPPVNVSEGTEVNWGHVYLADTLDDSNFIRSIKHVKTEVDVNHKIISEEDTIWPSLSLVAYAKGEHNMSSEQLRTKLYEHLKNNESVKSIAGLEALQPDISQALVFPYIPTHFETRPALNSLSLSYRPLEGKYVFIASTWDRSVDHYSIGNDVQMSLPNRILNMMNLVTNDNATTTIPGVYGHAVALENLLNGKILNTKRDTLDFGVEIGVFVTLYFVLFSFIHYIHRRSKELSLGNCFLFKRGLVSVESFPFIVSFILFIASLILSYYATIKVTSVAYNHFDIRFSPTLWWMIFLISTALYLFKEDSSDKDKNMDHS